MAAPALPWDDAEEASAPLDAGATPSAGESGVIPRDRYRPRTIFVNRIPRHELEASRAELEALDRDDPLPPIERPRTRVDCIDAPRPCPFVSCRHHLYLDVSRAGHIKLRFGDADVDEIPETCALDVVVDGETLERPAIARVLGIDRERVRQIEHQALAKLASRLGVDVRRLPVLQNDGDGDHDERAERTDEDLDDVDGGELLDELGQRGADEDLDELGEEAADE